MEVNAHDLAADPELYMRPFRVVGGRVVWERAQYGRGDKVRVDRIVTGERIEDGLHVVVAYLDPQTPVELVEPART